MTDTYEIRLKRARFRAWHRGFKEIDLILGRFADAHLEAFEPEDLEAFEALLTVPDQDLYDWITGRRPPPEAHAGPVLDRLRAFEPANHA